MTNLNRLDNKALRRAIHFLREAAVPCFVAGGTVRDRLLGRPSKDVDVVVEAGAISLARRLADATEGAFYVLDEDTDAARVLYRKPSGDFVVDVAAMRGPDLEADLRARDFTINAMAVTIADISSSEPEVIDPCGGRSDLAAGVLRATSEHAFSQDPIRMLRALRFEAKLGFQIEPATEAWIRRHAPLIVQSSPERIRDELAQLMSVRGAADRLRRAEGVGLLRHLLPELATLQGLVQSVPHIHDVYEHTILTVAEAERLSTFPDARLGLDEREYLQPFVVELEQHFGTVVSEGRTRATLFKFAAMLHDVGKSQTRSLESDGRIRALGHECVGAETAEAVLNRLRFSAREVRLVGTIVRHHMRPGWLLKSGPLSRRAIYRFYRDTGGAGVDICILALADQLATRGPTLTREHWRDYLNLNRAMLEGYFHKPEEMVAPPPLITGRDVMALLGLEPGPRIGELLEAVREAQAEGVVRTRAEALELLQSL